MLKILFTVLFTILTVLNNSNTLTYRIIYPDGTYESVIIDLNKTSFLKIGEYVICLKYDILLNNYSSSIVDESIKTIALEQSVDSSVIQFVDYVVKYVLIDLNNTVYELYYDANSNILVYGIILVKNGRFDYEIILRTKLNYLDKTVSVVESGVNKTDFLNTTSFSNFESSDILVNTFIFFFICLCLTFFSIIFFIKRKRK